MMAASEKRVDFRANPRGMGIGAVGRSPPRPPRPSRGWARAGWPPRRWRWWEQPRRPAALPTPVPLFTQVKGATPSSKKKQEGATFPPTEADTTSRFGGASATLTRGGWPRPRCGRSYTSRWRRTCWTPAAPSRMGRLASRCEPQPNAARRWGATMWAAVLSLASPAAGGDGSQREGGAGHHFVYCVPVCRPHARPSTASGLVDKSGCVGCARSAPRPSGCGPALCGVARGG